MGNVYRICFMFGSTVNSLVRKLYSKHCRLIVLKFESIPPQTMSVSLSLMVHPE